MKIVGIKKKNFCKGKYNISNFYHFDFALFREEIWNFFCLSVEIVKQKSY